MNYVSTEHRHSCQGLKCVEYIISIGDDTGFCILRFIFSGLDIEVRRQKCFIYL